MIVFDLDDTLYLERDFAFSGYRHLGRVVAARHGVEGFGAACRALFEAGERRGVIDGALERCGLDAALAGALIAEYRGHAPDISLEPDAVRCLERWAGREALGLITDGYAETQGAKVKALGVERWIGHVCLTGALGPGKGKPHPESYAAMEAAAPGARYVYVADNPAKDFVTPKARGWRTVQIVRDGGVHDPEPPDAAHAADVRIGTLDDLDGALG